jgi:hypothetical protein
MSAVRTLDALVRVRQWELDDAAAQLRALELRQSALRDGAAQVRGAARQLLRDLPPWPGSGGLELHRRTLLRLADFGAQAEAIRRQDAMLGDDIAAASRECSRRLLQLQAMRDHRERLLDEDRRDAQRGQHREADAAELARRGRCSMESAL